MKKFKDIFATKKLEKADSGISPLAEKYLSVVAGGGCPSGQEFHEYYQNSGDSGGPSSGGGAFWQQQCKFPKSTTSAFGGGS